MWVSLQEVSEKGRKTWAAMLEWGQVWDWQMCVTEQMWETKWWEQRNNRNFWIGRQEEIWREEGIKERKNMTNQGEEIFFKKEKSDK